MSTKPEIKLVHEGKTWLVVGKGARRDGKTFCHLASTTEFRKHRNGQIPLQIGDWIDDALLDAPVAANQPASCGAHAPRD